MSNKIGKKIIGIDIGGTKIRGVLWNGKKVLKTTELSTPQNLSSFKQSLFKIIRILGGTNRIAIGVAGIVSGKKIIKSPNIPYIKNFDFLATNFNFKVMALDNDARCFGHAEYRIGKAVSKKSVFFITIGTGIGRAFGKNGKILKIKKFECPEQWERGYQKLRNSKNDKALPEFLGNKIEKLIKPYNPQLMIVGGGMFRQKGFLKNFKKNINMPVKKARFYKNAVAVGAAMKLISM